MSVAWHLLSFASLVLHRQLKSLFCPYDTWWASKATAAATASFPTPPYDTLIDLEGAGQ